MDSTIKLIESAFSAIAFCLMLLMVLLFFGGAYAFLNAKLETEGFNTALVKSNRSEMVEDRDIVLYTGRTRYGTYFGDGSETVNLYGDSYATITKDNSAEYKTGEAATGASVFMEIQTLPNSVAQVEIDHIVLNNYPGHVDDETVSGHPNIAFYTNRGKTQDLLTAAGLDLTRNYVKSYEYDSRYGYITKIKYSRI